MKRSPYQTKQREYILRCLAQNEGEPMTAEAIAALLKDRVGKTTVYRNLERLTQERLLVRFDLNDGKGAYYQYCERGEEENHCHLLCTHCGKICELDCEHFSKLGLHIMNEHRFRLDRQQTVLLGTCEKCDLCNHST